MINVRQTIVRLAVTAALVIVSSVAPGAATVATDVCTASADPCRVTNKITVTDMSVLDFGARELRLENGGSLVAAIGAIAAGKMTINAGRLTIMSNGAISADGTASKNGGEIDINAGEITVDGKISAVGASGGTVTVTGTGRVTVGGTIDASRLANEGEGGEATVSGGVVTVTGNINAVGGLSAFGGDITINATGDLTYSGDIDVQGGDGGTIEMSAGVSNGAGNIVLANTATFDTDARSAGGFGGSVDLDARGDGVTTGNITMNAVLFCNGGTGTDETGGGDGGSISITAVGSVVTDAKSSDMEVQGGRPDGFGGELEVLTSKGGYTTNGEMIVGPLGAEGGGGDVTIDTGGDISMDGPIEGAGQSELLIDADGSVAVETHGSIDVSEGGSLCLGAGQGSPDVPGRIVVKGPLSANAGAIVLEARDAVTVSAPIHADGPAGGGMGGQVQITVSSGPAVLNNLISARATGGAAEGGIVTVDADGRVSVVGTIDATGAGMKGGMVGITSSSDAVDVSGAIRVGSAGAGGGGSVEAKSATELVVSGSIRADGGSAGAAGGLIELNSCSVNVSESGILSALRTNGINRIIGRREALVLGTMTADAQTGLNEFRYRAAQNAPVIFGTLQPAKTLVLDPTIPSCVECGNGMKEPPEECDDGNLRDGDGCSRSCTIEQILIGDANGDTAVDESDITAVIAEIFDGDGDSVADVASPNGTFPGNVGADANKNQRIESADIIAIIRIITGTQ